MERRLAGWRNSPKSILLLLPQASLHHNTRPRFAPRVVDRNALIRECWKNIHTHIICEFYPAAPMSNSSGGWWVCFGNYYELISDCLRCSFACVQAKRAVIGWVNKRDDAKIARKKLVGNKTGVSEWLMHFTVYVKALLTRYLNFLYLAHKGKF
jgi:hypothetical protein